MTSESLDKFFTWLPVCNTTEERSQQNSIGDENPHTNKIRESTKKINEFLKTSHLKLYSSYEKKKKKILSKIRKNSDVFHVSGFSDSELKTYYGSFKETRADDSINVHDDLFVWSYVKKQGMKEESVDAQKDSIWEPAINISIDDHHGKYDNENQYNRSYKAAGALLIKKHQSQKKNTCTHYNTRTASKNSVKNNTSCTDVLTETPSNGIEEINDSDIKVIRNKKLKNAKRNLRSAIDNVSLQVSETSETNLSCDFIPEDFQAQSTQIFSDTFTDANVPKSIRTKKACKFSSNDANNQPRDSGIEEDSRDENTAQENIENVKGNSLLKKSNKKTSSDRKINDEAKNKKQDNLSSGSTESCNTPRKKQCVKIIGEETITRKYKIIGKNTSPLQPIVEEKPTVPSSELNDKSGPSKHEPNNDSENYYKSVESGDEEESNSEEKAKESSDEYYDVHDDNNALSSEDEKVSLPEESGVKNESSETNVDSDSQDSRHRRRRINSELQKCTSPWVTKQYNDLKRLRLLEDSQDDSEFESNKKNKSGTIAKQKVSVKSKKTSKNITNEIEKLSNKSNTKSDKKKSFINGTLIDSDSEMNSPQVTNSDIDPKSIKNLNVEEDSMMRNASLSNEKEKSIENGDYSNSKLGSDSKEYSKSDTTGSHKSLHKNKKLKHRKKRQKANTTASVSSRENSYERQTQHDPKDVKSYKKSSQSREKTKSDYNESDDNKEDVDASSSKNNSSGRDSSALSINDIVKSKQAKKNGLKSEIFTASDDEKESEDEKMSENQKEKLQNVKKTDFKASDESSDSEAEREKVDLQNQNQNQSSCQKNERTNEKIMKESYESDNDDEFDGQEMKETILPHQENQNNESDEDDEGLPTLQAQEKLQQMKRLTFDNSSDSEDSEAETVSIHKHKSQLIKSETAEGPNFNEKSESVHEAGSDEERDDKDTMSENQKLHLQQMKKMDLMASDESSDSETEYNNADLQNKKESSCRKNERTIEKDTEKSNEFDGRESSKESQSDESDKEDEVLPTQHAQEKLQQMKRLKFDDSSESEDSETENVVINIHKSQVIKSEIAKEQNVNEKSEKEHTADSDKSSDEEDSVSENQKRKLQNCNKMDLMASDDSSVSETEHEHADSQNEKESSSRKNGGTSEKNTEKSHDSDDDGFDGQETKETIVPHQENQSDESDKEDDVLPTQHAQEKLQQMKRLNFDDNSESEDSETETALMNKHKTQVIKSEVAKDENVDEKSERVNRESSDKETDEEDTMSENQKNHLQQMKKMDLMASDESEDSDKEDKITKSRSGKLSDEKVKSDDSEDDDKTSDAALQEKLKLNKNKNGNSSGDSDTDSVHYDSDNIDVKEHKVIMPEDLKNSNLLEHFSESNTASPNTSKNGGQSESFSDRKNENKIENNEDEEIDNVVPVEVSRRMQQLKRLNLYDNSDSSESDESLKNNRNNTNVSQKSSNVPRKERDDSSSDEKENITEEPTTSKSNVNESEVNGTKEEFEDNVADEKELEKAVEETNKNVIIPETQESEDFVSDNIQSQEMFSSLENLAENPSQIPATPKRDSKKPTKKITEMAELVEQEELIKSSLEPTMTLDDIDSDDDEIFVIEVPKNVFDAELIGKKLVVTKSTLSIGDSHYEAVNKDTSPIMSCVLNSKRKKYKTVNVRPLRSIVARRKKDADDYIENAEIENRQKNQRSVRKSDQELIHEALDVEPASKKKSKPKNRKLSRTDEAASSSSVKLEESKLSKKKSAKNKKVDPHDFIRTVEISEENSENGEAKMSKTLKRKLYASDHEIKDVDSNATDDSFVNTNNSFKKLKNSKKVTDTANTSAKAVEKTIRKKLTLKNLNVENKIASVAKNENNDEVEITEQSQSKTKAKKKSNKKATQQEPEEECQSEKVTNTLEDNKEMFKNMFRESFLVNVSIVEEEPPVKKKAKKRTNTSADVNSESKAKTKKKSKTEEVEESADAVVKPKRTRKKVDKPKEEPASVQIMKFINDAFKANGEKLNVSTSSNESRYGALDIERVSTKKNYSSSSSSDESEKKYARPRFQIRDKSKEKDLPGPSTSSCGTTLFKQEIKDEKKKIKKIVFDE